MRADKEQMSEYDTKQKETITMKKMNWILYITLSLIVLGIASYASASIVYFEVTGMPTYKQTNIRGSNHPTLGGNVTDSINPSGGIGYDARGTLGLTYGGFMVGFGTNLSYTPEKGDPTAAIEGTDISLTTLEYGPAFGVVYKGFHLVGTWILSGNRKLSDRRYDSAGTDTGNITYQEKIQTGYQVNLGYAFSVSSKFRIGPSLIFRKRTYESRTIANAIDPTDPGTNVTDQTFVSPPTVSEFTPALTLAFEF